MSSGLPSSELPSSRSSQTGSTATETWPQAPEYAAALADGSLDLTPLLAGQPEFVHRRFAQPVGRTGSSAVVYPIEVDHQRKALRLFTRASEVPIERYRRLADEHFDETPLEIPQLVPNSVVVDGVAFPALVGPWIEGPNLDDWVDQRVDEGDVGALIAMRGQWLDIVRSMQVQPMAHGDLQHGNVIVAANNQIELVDLDGVWTPSTADLVPNERGHEHYQHPRFTPDQDWNQFADTFPAAVISLGLAIACEDPNFWRQSRARSEDQMVIGAEHFANIDHPLWQVLVASPSASVAWSARLVRDAIAAPRPPQCALGVLGRHDELPPPPPSAPPEAVALDMPYGSEASTPAPPEQSDGQPLPIVPDLPPPDAEIPAYLRRARGEDI